MKKILLCFLIILLFPVEADALSKADKDLFYRAVEAEATEGGYEEKLRVANVICNGVNNPAFPNSIRAVITEKHTVKGKTYYQFCVVRDNRINKVTPSKDTVRAVNDALSGKWIMSDKVTFFNTKGLKSYARRNHTYWGSDNIHDFFY